MLEDLNVEMYIVSKDLPEEQLQLFNAIKDNHGHSLSFVSDPNLELTELMGMKNGDVAYRGYGMIDSDGNVIFNTKNDHWGEQLENTVKEIKDNYKDLQ